MDEDNSGTISLDEITEYFVDPRVQAYFQALDMDPNDIERLFMLSSKLRCYRIHFK